MGKVSKFEDLEVWQLARVVCQEIFRISQTTSLAKDFDLKSQINRSSGSVMDNIAEGFERNGSKEFIHFLSIAKGSCGEARSQLNRILDRNYITTEEFSKIENDLITISKKISGFIKYLKESEIKGYKFMEDVEPYITSKL